ncbi:MAG: hypothetical protein K8T25_10555 [Planctomycetia bacterium]|nr:hypothetical protein [Planctomycetia bacterium]
MEGDGKVKMQIGGRGFYARIQVICHDGSDIPRSVTVAPSADDPWYRREGWTDAGLAGAALGLKLAGSSSSCTITQIHGMPCDTNATLMAIAAIRAVWAAVSFVPDETMAQRLEACVLRKMEVAPADLERELADPKE